MQDTTASKDKRTATSASNAAGGERRARDRRGQPLSTSPEAAAFYREAVEAVLASGPRVAELLDRAIASDPSFAVAQAARWMQAHGEGDRSRARQARAAALSSLDSVSAWERGHVECIAALLHHDDDAWARCQRHLEAHPLDLVVASQLIGDLFFHGGVGKREAVVDLLQSLAPHHGGDWAYLARLGFHMSELGDHRNAIWVIDRALKERPDAPFVAHAMAHALLESGQRAASYRFLVDWVSRHDASGPIDGHIQWHLSLGELESGDAQAAAARYVRESAPDVSHCASGLLLADAGGLFLRMALADDVGDRAPRALLHELLDELKGALKIPFVSVHAAALAVALADADADLYLNAIEEAMVGKGGAAANVVEALQAYRAGEMDRCIIALERDRATMWEALGGSNEERALFAALYDSACARREQSSANTSTPREHARLLTGAATRIALAVLPLLLTVCAAAPAARSTSTPAPRSAVTSVDRSLPASASAFATLNQPAKKSLWKIEPCVEVPVEQMSCEAHAE